MLRHHLVRTAAVVAAGLALTAGSMGPAPVSASVVTTHTFASTHPRMFIGGLSETTLGFGMTVNDGQASLYPSVTGITGLAGTVTDVEVRIKGFSHQRPDDVDIMLRGPYDQTVMLMSDVGGSASVSGLDLTFDDQAAAGIDPANAPQSGIWRPSNQGAGDPFPSPAPTTEPASSLDEFDGLPANGPWSLFVVDDTGGSTGSIEEFWIDIEATGTTQYPSRITVEGLPPKVTDVDVSLEELRHIWAPDLDLLLVGPQGQQATILSDPGPLDGSSADLTLDDEAADDLPIRLVDGTFRPANAYGVDAFPAPAPTATGDSALSVFDGTDPNGVWSLYVADDSQRDDGTLDGWSLQITVEGGPEPDTQRPRVTTKLPGAEASGVRRGADVVAVFDEQLQPGTVVRRTAYVVRRGSIGRVPAQVSWDPVSLRIVIDPDRRLRPRTTYRVVITSQVTDLAGNRLDQDRRTRGTQPATWRFTTR